MPGVSTASARCSTAKRHRTGDRNASGSMDRSKEESHPIHVRERRDIHERGCSRQMAVIDGARSHRLAIGIYPEERPHRLAPIPSSLFSVKQAAIKQCVLAIIVRDVGARWCDILKSLDQVRFLRCWCTRSEAHARPAGSKFSATQDTPFIAFIPIGQRGSSPSPALLKGRDTPS
jgi:hypothetical protein